MELEISWSRENKYLGLIFYNCIIHNITISSVQSNIICTDLKCVLNDILNKYTIECRLDNLSRVYLHMVNPPNMYFNDIITDFYYSILGIQYNFESILSDIIGDG